MNATFKTGRPVAAAIITMCLAACQTPPPPDTVQARAEAVVAGMPTWFAAPPATEGQWLYAAGTDTSSDPQFAIDRALLAATRTLALQRAGHIAATSRDFVSESGPVNARSQNGQADRATKLSVSAMLGAYTVVETKLIPSNGQYRAYILIRCARPDTTTPAPQADAAKMKGKEEEDRTKGEAEKAFKALDKEDEAAAIEPPSTVPVQQRKAAAIVEEPPAPKSAAQPKVLTSEVIRPEASIEESN